MLQAVEIPFLCPNSIVCGIHTGKPVKTLEDLKGLKINGGPPAVPIT